MVVQSPPYTALKPTRHPSWSEGKSDRLRGLRTRIRHRQRYSLDAQNIINRSFKPLLKRAELPDIRWHDLRQTYATLLLARGTHPTYVQKSLGHASVQLTLDRYSHWIPSMERATAEGRDEALG
jgi:integrase